MSIFATILVRNQGPESWIGDRITLKESVKNFAFYASRSINPGNIEFNPGVPILDLGFDDVKLVYGACESKSLINSNKNY